MSFLCCYAAASLGEWQTAYVRNSTLLNSSHQARKPMHRLGIPQDVRADRTWWDKCGCITSVIYSPGLTQEDRRRVVAAALQRPPTEWKRCPGSPATSRLRTVETSNWILRGAKHPTELTGMKLSARLRSFRACQWINILKDFNCHWPWLTSNHLSVAILGHLYPLNGRRSVHNMSARRNHVRHRCC